MLPAVLGGDAAAVAALLDADPDSACESVGNSLDPPLLLAAKRGHAEIARLLLPLLSAQEASVRDPLSCAARNGHTEVIRALREAPNGITIDHARLCKHVRRDLLSLPVLDELLQFPSTFSSTHAGLRAIGRLIKWDKDDETRPRTRLFLRHCVANADRQGVFFSATVRAEAEWALLEGARALGFQSVPASAWVFAVKHNWAHVVREATCALPGHAVNECHSVAMLRALHDSPHNRPALLRPQLVTTLWARRSAKRMPTNVLVRPLLQLLEPAQRDALLAAALPLRVLGVAANRLRSKPHTPLGVAIERLMQFAGAGMDATVLEAVLDLTDTPRDEQLVQRVLECFFRGPGRAACGQRLQQVQEVLGVLLSHPSCPPISLDDVHAVVTRATLGYLRDVVWKVLLQCLRARRTAASSRCTPAELQAALRCAGCPHNVVAAVETFGLWARRRPLVLLRQLVRQERVAAAAGPGDVVRFLVERAPAQPWRCVVAFL